MSLIFPKVKPTCNISHDLICAKSVIQDLNLIIDDFKIRNDNVTKEILAINYVIKILQNETFDVFVMKNLTLVEQIAIPYLNLTLNEMKRQLSTPGAVDIFNTIYYGYDRSVLYFYLPRLLKMVEQLNIMLLIEKFHHFADGIRLDDFCLVLEVFYSELKLRSELESIEAFFFSIFIELLIQEELMKWGPFSEPGQCPSLVENLSNVSEKYLAEYERIYLSNDSSNVETLKKQHEIYYLAIPFVLPKLVKRVNMNTAEDAEKMLSFIKRIAKVFPSIACPGFLALIIKMKSSLKTSNICKAIRSAKTADTAVDYFGIFKIKFLKKKCSESEDLCIFNNN